MNSPTSTTLRKAAVLVHSLDPASADALLEQMGEAQAARVREAVMEIDHVDEAEQQAVIAEFIRGEARGAGRESLVPGPAAPPPDDCEGGVEGEASDDEDSAAPAFHSLRQAETATIASLLQGEHPQTIALVLAHLPPDRAAQVLQQIAPSIQVIVLQRIAELEPADPEVLRELERQLQTRLDQQVGMCRQPSAGLSALQAILRASGGGQRAALLKRLALVDRQLAGHCVAESGAEKPEHPARLDDSARTARPAPRASAAPFSSDGAERTEAMSRLEFADLADWNPASLAFLLQAAPPELALLALAGADEALMRRLTQPLSTRQVRALQRKIAGQGPLRLRDIQIAQQRMARLARQLVASGQLDPPSPPRFATAI